MKKIQFFSLILVVGLLAIIWWAVANRLTLAAGPLLQERGASPDLAVPTPTPTPQLVESEAVSVPWQALRPSSSSSITVTVPFPHRPFDSDMLRSGQSMPSNDYKLSVTSNAFNALTSPRVIYVNHGTRSLARGGVSWNTAYSSIQDALAVAAKGDEIWVAKGIYAIAQNSPCEWVDAPARLPDPAVQKASQESRH